MAALTVRRFLRPFTALEGPMPSARASSLPRSTRRKPRRADMDGILEITLPKAERIQQIGPGARARDPQDAS
jgi:hypothetical protein